MHPGLLRMMHRAMLRLMATARIYTALDDVVDEALSRATEAGLVAESSSKSATLHALVEYANDRLREEHEREEKLAAYKELAADTERSAAIREANLAAAAGGVL